MKAFFTILIALFLSHAICYADTGCQLSSGVIHSPQTGTALLGASLIPFRAGVLIPFYNSPSVSTAVGTCPNWAGGIGFTGRKCTTSALTILGLGLVAENEGNEVTFNYIECDLDRYAWIMGLVFSSIGYAYIKSRAR